MGAKKLIICSLFAIMLWAHTMALSWAWAWAPSIRSFQSDSIIDF